MTFNFLGPGLTVNVEAKVKEQIILDSSEVEQKLYIGTLDAVKIRKNRQSPSLLPKAASYQIVKDL